MEATGFGSDIQRYERGARDSGCKVVALHVANDGRGLRIFAFKEDSYKNVIKKD